MRDFKDDTLKQVREFIEKNSVEVSESQKRIKEVLEEESKSSVNDNISIYYDVERKQAVCVVEYRHKDVYTEHMTESEYVELLHSLQVDAEKGDYYFYYEGEGCTVRAFVYKEGLEAPAVSLLFVKDPPISWVPLDLNKTLKEVSKDNYLVVGQKGSGKNYLLNFMLKEKHSLSKDRVCLFERSKEFVKPNDLSLSFTFGKYSPGEVSYASVTEKAKYFPFDAVYVDELDEQTAPHFLDLLYSGVKGASTLTAPDAETALEKLTSLASDRLKDKIHKCIKHLIIMNNKDIDTIMRIIMKDNKIKLESIY